MTFIELKLYEPTKTNVDSPAVKSPNLLMSKVGKNPLLNLMKAIPTAQIRWLKAIKIGDPFCNHSLRLKYLDSNY